MKNKKKGILLMILSLVVVVSSLAFFTDSKVDSIKMAFGNLGLISELKAKTQVDNIAPGDSIAFDLNLSNIGSIDGLIRTTYRLSVAEDRISEYALGDVTLSVDGVDVLDKVNVEGISGDVKLSSKEGVSHELLIKVSNVNKNNKQAETFKLEVLTELKQEGSTDWVSLGTESITFGGNEDFNVVPSNNQLITDEMKVYRKSLGVAEESGYVLIPMNLAGQQPVEDFKKQFYNEIDHIKVKDKNGIEFAEGDNVEQEATVSLEISGVEYDRLLVVVKGDLDANGAYTMNDMDKMSSLIYNTPSQDITAYDLAVADLDDDGLMTYNDRRILTDLIASSREFDKYYPQKPNLRNKPKQTLTLLSDNVIDFDHETDLRSIISEGSKIKAGDVFKIAVKIDNLQDMRIHGLDSIIIIDEDVMEFVGTADDFYAQIRNDFFPVGIRGKKWTDRLAIENYKDYGKGTVMYATDSRQSFYTGDSDFYLKNSGEYFILAVRVKDGTPSGTPLNMELKGGFTYHTQGSYSFYDTFNTSKSKLFVE